MKEKIYARIFTTFLTAAVAAALFSIPSVADTGTAWEEQYRDEPYIFLISEETIELREDFTTATTVRGVARIQNEAGKEIGEIKLTYDQSREVITEIEGYTTTPDGKKLKAETIQDLAPNKDYAVYSDERVKVITMPSVVPESTIKFTVKSETTKPVIADQFYKRFHFSFFYPVKTCIFRLIAPKDIALHFKYFNHEHKPVISHDGDKVIYTWEISEGRKVEPEEYMPSLDEVLDSVTISTVKSWEDISSWSWELFRKNMRISDEMKAKVEELTGGLETTADKVQAIIDYIRKDFRYVSMNIDFHNYEPHPADQIFTNKYGDCKDQTVLGMAMLSEIGIKAYPVLYPESPTFNGKERLPMPDYFNHAILFFEMDGQKYYTDLLRKGYRFAQVPRPMSGVNVFVVNGNGGFFGTVPETDSAEATTTQREHTVIDESGDAVIEMTTVFSRESSNQIREMFKRMSASMKEKAYSSFEAELAAGGQVIERRWENIDKPYERITVYLKFTGSHSVQKVDTMMIFGLPQVKRSSMFSSPKRIHPIVSPSDVVVETQVTYDFPEGYEIMNLPAPVNIENTFSGYERSYQADGSSIVGKELYILKKSRTPADQYQKIKDFFDDVMKSTNDRIMIRKKG